MGHKTPISNVINNSKKIVLKVGSNVLRNDDGTANINVFKNLTDQVAEMMEQGKQVIIVSSGAGIYGVAAIDRWSRRNDMNYKQALCAIGQVELMMVYKEHFAAHGIHVGQMLLTREDFSDEENTLHIRNTLFTLTDEQVVPIINENDSVSVDEIKTGDNDTLSALTACLWNADVLICLSDIDGVFDCDPKSNKDAELIEEVYDVDGLLDEIDIHGKSDFGTGGIATKIEAARKAARYYIPTVLLNGKKEDILRKAAAGEETGTVFFIYEEKRS